MTRACVCDGRVEDEQGGDPCYCTAKLSSGVISSDSSAIPTGATDCKSTVVFCSNVGVCIHCRKRHCNVI